MNRICTQFNPISASENIFLSQRTSTGPGPSTICSATSDDGFEPDGPPTAPSACNGCASITAKANAPYKPAFAPSDELVGMIDKDLQAAWARKRQAEKPDGLARRIIARLDLTPTSMPDLDAPTDMEAASTSIGYRFESLLSGIARRVTTKKMHSVPISSETDGLEPRFMMALVRELSIPVPMELQRDGRAVTDLDGWIADLKVFKAEHPWQTTFDTELRQWLAAKDGHVQEWKWATLKLTDDGDIVLTPKKRS